MFETILEYFAMYGYWVVFFGSLIEGESIVLTAGYLASQGKLNLYLIMIIAFVATLIADQLSFYFGHHYGKSYINKHEWLHSKSKRVIRLLHKYDIWFIMLMRFIYGIRIAGPIIVGASGLSPRRFAMWNVPSAAVWSIVSCSAGYFLGEAIHWVLKNTDYVAMFVLGLILVIWGIVTVHRWLMKKFE